MRATRLWLVTFVLVAVAGQAAVGMRASRTATVTGDEPFYLATAQSLVSDGDLDLRDEYAAPGQREFRRFWDGTVPLWRQMQPTADGRLLAPHEPGLPLLIAPAYAVGGLEGVRRFLVLVWAAAMAFAALLVRRVLPGAPAVLVVGAAVVVGAGVPGLVYASQVYPEGAAALCVAAALVLVAGVRDRARPLLLAVVLVALAWLGVKYVPLAALLAGFWARSWRHVVTGAPKTRWWPAAAFVAIAAAHYVWWHLHTFGGLTPYGTNVVWAGEATASIVADHIDLTNRTYRLYGLFIDARFGLFVWLPAAVLAIAGVGAGVGKATVRYTAVLTVCVLMGTFASITIMGWWFPGRMLIAAFPALVVLVAAGAVRLPRSVGAALGAWSLAIAATTAWGAHHRWIRLAVDPFDLGVPLPPRWLFPDFREFAAPEILVSLGWLVAAVGLVSFARWRPSCSWTATPLPTAPSSRSRPRWRPLPGR